MYGVEGMAPAIYFSVTSSIMYCGKHLQIYLLLLFVNVDFESTTNNIAIGIMGSLELHHALTHCDLQENFTRIIYKI